MNEKKSFDPRYMAYLTMIFDNYGDSQSLRICLGIFKSPSAAEEYRKRIQDNNTKITTIMEVFKIK